MNIEVKEEKRKWKFEIELDEEELEIITNSLALNNDVTDIHIMSNKSEEMFYNFKDTCLELGVKLETLE